MQHSISSGLILLGLGALPILLLTACPPPLSGTVEDGLFMSAGEQLRFSYDVPSGATDVRFLLVNVEGDPDLYVAFERAPTLQDYDCRPYLKAGENEFCEFGESSGGTYHVMIYAYSEVQNADLIALYRPQANPTCGNGVVEAHEVCDDGDRFDDNLCSSDCQTLNFDCSGDHFEASESGSIFIEPTDTFIPLCDGWMITGDQSANGIRIWNPARDLSLLEFPLYTAPHDIVLDRKRGFLYVAPTPATSLIKIDLITQTQSSIELSAENLGLEHAAFPEYLAVGNDGQVFATLDDNETWPDRAVALVNGVQESVVTTWVGDFDRLIAFNPHSSELILGALGYSPSSLTRFSFDPVELTLVETQHLRNPGSNGQELNLSPDGEHLVFPCGGGNGNGYTMFDFSTHDFNQVYGEWDTGAYPTAAAFSRDGDHLLATNRYEVLVFEVNTHVELSAEVVDNSGCSYDDVMEVGFSQGKQLKYLLLECGFDNDSAKLIWSSSGL